MSANNWRDNFVKELARQLGAHPDSPCARTIRACLEDHAPPQERPEEITQTAALNSLQGVPLIATSPRTPPPNPAGAGPGATVEPRAKETVQKLLAQYGITNTDLEIALLRYMIERWDAAAPAPSEDSRRMDRLDTLWGQFKHSKGHYVAGHWIPNINLSFRQSWDAYKSSTKPHP